LIRPETIAQVRERTDLVALVSESVPSLKRRGRSFVGLCPFHKEKTGSFHVNPDRGFFHCFGCKESGSAIDFVMKHDGLTFPEAVRLLADRCGIEVEEDHGARASEADHAKKRKDELLGALALAATFFEEQLRSHPDRRDALEELGRRGLVPGTDPLVDEALQAFRIGYAPPGWDGLATFFRDQRVSPLLAEQVGLLVPRQGTSGHYDRFRHRLMFAVMDPQGRVVAFSGRALPEPDHGQERGDGRDPPPKYVNSPESPVYKKGELLFGLWQARHAIRQEQRAVLVEGNFDVVSLHARGLRNVVAPLGTAFTAPQAKLLRRYAPKVTLFFDGDAAGRKATRMAREPCREAGLAAQVAVTPPGTDPDELARTRGVEAVRETIAGARGLLEHLIDLALDETFVAADSHERAARVAYVARLLAEEDDPLVRSMAKTHADNLAGRLMIVTPAQSGRGDRSPDAFRALEQAVRRALADEHRPAPRGAEPERARVHGQPAKAAKGAMVGALLDFPGLFYDAEVQDALSVLDGDAARTVAVLAANLHAREDGEIALDIDGFLAQMPPPIQAFAQRRLAAPAHESREEARTELLMNAAKLKDMLARDASAVMREMRSAQDFEEQLALAREEQERARRARGIKA
jgi:DNA primase